MADSKDDVFVVCVSKNSPHIDESILTNCCDCNKQVWCSITNADKKPLCIPCMLIRAEKEGAEVGVTPETLEEAKREIKKINKRRI